MAFDIDTPSPDAGHEAIRIAVVQAIADLSTTSGTADLLQMIVGFFQDNIDSLLGADAQLSARDDALEARIAALEATVQQLTGSTP